jgi:hypothetical protein
LPVSCENLNKVSLLHSPMQIKLNIRLESVLIVIMPLPFVRGVVVVFVQVEWDERDGLMVGKVVLPLGVAYLVDHLDE